MAWICKKCGLKLNLKNSASPYQCKKCHNEYMRNYDRTEYSREYMRTRRWLNGGPDNYLLGEKKERIICNVQNGKMLLRSK